MGQGIRGCEMTLMLAFCVASDTCRASSIQAQVPSHLSACVASYIRTQKELTPPAQKLLIPEYQMRHFSTFPCSFASSPPLIASYIPSPELLNKCHPSPQDPGTISCSSLPVFFSMSSTHRVLDL